jgi:lipoyl(octanoyl) transferase
LRPEYCHKVRIREGFRAPMAYPSPEFRIEPEPVAYAAAIAAMESRVEAIRNGTARERVWLLEHPPLYTAGTSARDEELLDRRFPVFKTGRGGRWTYHGPGQRIAYVMLDLKARGGDVRAFVCSLENWVMAALGQFGILAARRPGRVGLWVPLPGGGAELPAEAKIAAVGVRIRRWVTYHGVAINRDPDLSHFDGIVPCGIRDHGVTSMAALGVSATAAELDRALIESWDQAFGDAAACAA